MVSRIPNISVRQISNKLKPYKQNEACGLSIKTEKCPLFVGVMKKKTGEYLQIKTGNFNFATTVHHRTAF